MKKLYVVLAAVVFSLAVGSVAFSQSEFMATVAKEAGRAVANKLEVMGLLNTGIVAEPSGQSGDIALGSGAHITSLKQTATVATTASSTAATILNNSGRMRIVELVNAWFANTATTSADVTQARVIEFGTSTDQYASSSIPLLTTTFTTSTADQFYSTSTFTQVWKRLWRNGEYLNVTLNRAASTSFGVFAVEYYEAVSSTGP